MKLLLGLAIFFSFFAVSHVLKTKKLNKINDDSLNNNEELNIFKQSLNILVYSKILTNNY